MNLKSITYLLRYIFGMGPIKTWDIGIDYYIGEDYHTDLLEFEQLSDYVIKVYYVFPMYMKLRSIVFTEYQEGWKYKASGSHFNYFYKLLPNESNFVKPGDSIEFDCCIVNGNVDIVRIDRL